MSELRVGTPVMVVRTGTQLDGMTGEISGPLKWYAGRCVCHRAWGLSRGYEVMLSRSVLGGPRWSLARQYLVPLTPPDEAIESQRFALYGVTPERLAA